MPCSRSALLLPSLLAAMTFGLAGCYGEATNSVTPPTVPATIPSAGTDTCGTGPLRGLVGQPVSKLPAALAGPSLRVIHPGQPVTQDFRAERMNVHLDRRDFITGITCG